MRNVKDLSTTKGTYTKVLEDNMESINSNYATMNFATFKSYIINLVNQAHNTNARAQFLYNIERKRNKDELLFLVTNAWLRGQGLGTNINDKFAFVK